DLHSHGQTPENYRYKAMDGVTAALELERGTSTVREWYAEREGKALIHYGASVGHIPVRMAIMKDTGTRFPRDAAVNRPATAEEQRTMLLIVENGLREGALGVGIGLGPATTPEEGLDLFYLAAKWNRPVFVHMRDAGLVASLQEVIADCAISGASLHVMHIN